MPGPDQVPPAGVADKVTSESDKHKSSCLVIFMSGVGLTVIVIWALSVQVPVLTV